MFSTIYICAVGHLSHIFAPGVFRKANIFTVHTSKLISINVESSKNCIECEFRSGMIYEQSIRWGRSDVQVPFSLSTIIVFCTCKYFNKRQYIMDSAVSISLANYDEYSICRNNMTTISFVLYLM